MPKIRLNTYFDPDLFDRLETTAAGRRVAKTHIVEAALASFLTPDDADRREAALTRRLDRQTRILERLERNQDIAIEAQALFVRFWLLSVPPISDEMHAGAQAAARERYDSYIDALMRRLVSGKTLANEISREVPAEPHPDDGPKG
jgi:hypothetical protein